MATFAADKENKEGLALAVKPRWIMKKTKTVGERNWRNRRCYSDVVAVGGKTCFGKGREAGRARS